MKITKTTSGKWSCHFYIGKDENGKKKFKNLTDSDKTRLKQKVAQYIAEHGGTATAADVSLKDAVKRYIDSRDATCSPATLKGYKSMERTLNSEHKEFLALPISAINAANYQEFINKLHKKGNRPKTLRNFRGLISAAIKYCEYSAPDVHIPQGIPFEPNTPDVENVQKLLKACSGTRLEIPIRLGIYGLRRSEICGLKKDHIEGNVAHIQIVVVEGDDGLLHEKEAKTDLSDRYVALDDELCALIGQCEDKVTTYTPKAITDAFTRLLNMTDLPHFRFHDLRGFFASYCHDVLKLSDAQIQKLGGWKTDYVMKARYRRAISDAADEVATSIGSLVTS